jgi:hypothetical protein
MSSTKEFNSMFKIIGVGNQEDQGTFIPMIWIIIVLLMSPQGSILGTPEVGRCHNPIVIAGTFLISITGVKRDFADDKLQLVRT